MKYDVETAVDRRGTGAYKWSKLEEVCGDSSENIFPFSVADNDLPTLPPIVDGLKQALGTAVFGYTAASAAYRNAVCGWMKGQHGWEIQPEWIVPCSGVVYALYNCVRAYTKPQDGVLIMTPVYPPFYSAVTENGRRVVENPLLWKDGHYAIDFADLERKAKDPANTLLLLCSPHNPIGRVWTEEELLKIGDICLQNGVAVISDEIHSDLILPGFRHIPLVSLREEFAGRFVTCTAPSKTFNLAGLQCSNIIIQNPEVRSAFQKAMGKTGHSDVNVLGMKACEIAYTQCGDWPEQFASLIDRNRRLCEEFMAAHIPEIKVRPMQGTYLQWWDCRGLGMTRETLEDFLYTKALLFANQGYTFGTGGEGFVRMNIACPTHVLEQALLRLEQALRQR